MLRRRTRRCRCTRARARRRSRCCSSGRRRRRSRRLIRHTGAPLPPHMGAPRLRLGAHRLRCTPDWHRSCSRRLIRHMGAPALLMSVLHTGLARLSCASARALLHTPCHCAARAWVTGRWDCAWLGPCWHRICANGVWWRGQGMPQVEQCAARTMQCGSWVCGCRPMGCMAHPAPGGLLHTLETGHWAHRRAALAAGVHQSLHNRIELAVVVHGTMDGLEACCTGLHVKILGDRVGMWLLGCKRGTAA